MPFFFAGSKQHEVQFIYRNEGTKRTKENYEKAPLENPDLVGYINKTKQMDLACLLCGN